MRGNVEGNPVTLMNIYVPAGSDLSFFQRVVNIMVAETESFLICGGDLNISLQPELDNSNRKVPDSSTLQVRTLFEEVGLIERSFS